MHAKGILYVLGYVEIEIHGGEIERFMNLATMKGIAIWQLRRTGPDRISCRTDLKSFFLLRPLLRECGCKVRTGRRHGLPFLLKKLETRAFFAAGLIGFVIVIYLLSQVVWKVEVTGNERITEDQVMEAAEQLGIRALQWKWRLGEPQQLSQQLTRLLDGASWVGVAWNGTRVKISIVEQTIPEDKPLMNPRHLVAAFDAVVTRMHVEQGKPQVRVNTRVKKGDLLVSGIIGSPDNSAIVVAKGDVLGLVWHEFEIRSPLSYTYHSYTGERRTRYYGVIGSRALQLTGYGKLEFEDYEKLVQRKTLSFRKVKLPLGYIREEWMETHDTSSEIGYEDAKQIGLTRARNELLQKAGPDAVIKDEIILHEKSEGGKVYMKVLFEVEQQIAAELPII